MWIRLGESTDLLICEELVGFWKGHSPKKFLNGRAALAGVKKAERDYLGRWKPDQSDDYLITARTVVWKIQEKVAKKIKSGSRLDESVALGDVKKFLEVKGVGSEAVAGALDKLDASVFLGEQLGSEDCEAEEDEVPVLVSTDLENAEDSEDEFKPVEDVPYFVSITKGGRFRRVHKTPKFGGCWRRPGLHIQEFEYVSILEKGSYHAVCKDCWRRDDDGSSSDSPTTGNEDNYLEEEVLKAIKDCKPDA